MDHIFIVGESPLVEEYGALCASRRHKVSARLNRGEKGKLPKGVRSVQVTPKSATVALELTNLSPAFKKKNLVSLDRSLPSSVPILSSSVTVSVAEQAGWLENRQRLIGIGALPSLLKRDLVECARSEATHERTVQQARQFLSSLGKESAVVGDSIGLVTPRVISMLVNEAYFAIMEGVATAEDIDTAMKLGTNYPSGPVERCREIGIQHIHAVLSALYSHFREDRYRIAPLLEKTALGSRA